MAQITTKMQVRAGFEGDLLGLAGLYGCFTSETSITFGAAATLLGVLFVAAPSDREDGTGGCMVAQDDRSGRNLKYVGIGPSGPPLRLWSRPLRLWSRSIGSAPRLRPPA